MKPLTRDQADVLKALAARGGGSKTRAELATHFSHVGRMKAARRNEAIRVLVARGFADPVEVETSTEQIGYVARIVREGWRITPDGAAALRKEGATA